VTRRAAAGAAAVLLLALVLATQTWNELPRRVRVVITYAPKELAVRRLGGSGTAFDRKFFSFLENARRRLPASTPGVVLERPPGDPSYRYLSVYYLAPLDVSDGRQSQWGPPRGWITAAYGVHPASDVGVFARLPEGALLGPSPGPESGPFARPMPPPEPR
jgi:hypothetical protein